jgi:hypothetical protein
VGAPKDMLMVLSRAFAKGAIIRMSWVVPMSNLARREILVAQFDKVRTAGAMDRGRNTVSVPINCRENNTTYRIAGQHGQSLGLLSSNSCG